MYPYLLAILIGLAGCQQPADEISTLDPGKLSEIDTTIERAIAEKQTPGGVFWLEHDGEVYSKTYGNRALEPEVERTTLDTIYDAASMTKVMATAPAIMLLIERGQIELDAPAHLYLPEFTSNGKDAITVRHLLTHTSGLRAGLSPTIRTLDEWVRWDGSETAIKLASEERLQSKPGTEFLYSDINFLVLGEIIRRVSGQRLDEFARNEIYLPLKMLDTMFLPAASFHSRIAPTVEVERGTVHDPTARQMGGVAGNAGVFTTAEDVARFARMILNEGELDGIRIFQPETVSLMTSVQSPARLDDWRGLGWDMDTAYTGERGNIFPLGGFGHTGFTGPSLWIDPYSKSFVIFMSNRVHPNGTGNVVPLRRQLGTLAAEAINDFDFTDVPEALTKVRNGIDVLAAQDFEPLKGLKVGLITNHTGLDRNGVSTIDLLANAEDIELITLFSPEHGIRGEFDENVGDGKDEKTGLPIYSLYGETRKPLPEQLENLDALVFDIQDIGTRFYTYISTMGLAMEAASEAGIRFVVLDRINPINGVTIEGPLRKGPSRFTGFHDIPVRHGMTIGELAGMFRTEREINVDLVVVPVEGWRREMFFDETGFAWVNPSPNMRSLTQAILYPGVGLLEASAISVGRGTDTPFEIIGAPYINELEFAAELNRANIPGVRFVPVRFTPDASKFANQLCRGVNIILTDRENCPVVNIGVTAAQILHRLYAPDFDLTPFNNLLMNPDTVEMIRSGKQPDEIIASWQQEVSTFHERRKSFLIYSEL